MEEESPRTAELPVIEQISGIKKEQIISEGEEEIISSLTCLNCARIALKPLYCSSCKMLVCKPCGVSIWNCLMCPKCKSTKLTTEIPTLYNYPLQNLIFRCFNYPSCTAELSYSDLLEHKCRYDLFKCDGPGCAQILPRGDLISHQSACQHMLLMCKHPECAYMGERGRMHIHMDECEYREAFCIGCDVPLLAKEKSSHEMTCGSVPIKCPKGCGQLLTREQMTVHSESCKLDSDICSICKVNTVENPHEGNCPHNIYKCGECGFSGTYDALQSHNCVAYLGKLCKEKGIKGGEIQEGIQYKLKLEELEDKMSECIKSQIKMEKKMDKLKKLKVKKKLKRVKELKKKVKELEEGYMELKEENLIFEEFRKNEFEEKMESKYKEFVKGVGQEVGLRASKQQHSQEQKLLDLHASIHETLKKYDQEVKIIKIDQKHIQDSSNKSHKITKKLEEDSLNNRKSQKIVQERLEEHENICNKREERGNKLSEEWKEKEVTQESNWRSLQENIYNLQKCTSAGLRGYVSASVDHSIQFMHKNMKEREGSRYISEDGGFLRILQLRNKLLAVSKHTGVVDILNPFTGQLLRSIVAHDNGMYIWGMEELSDASLATASNDHTIKIWNVTHGNLLRVLLGHVDKVYTVREHSSKNIISGSGIYILYIYIYIEDQTVKIWDPIGNCLHTIDSFEAPIWENMELPNDKVVSLSPGSSISAIKIWEFSTQETLHNVPSYGQAWDCGCVLDDERVVLGGHLGLIKVLNIGNLSEKVIFKVHEGRVKQVTVIGSRVLTCSEDNAVKMIELESGELIYGNLGHTDWVCSVIPIYQ